MQTSEWPDDAYRAIAQAVQTGQIGVPVAARVVDCVETDHGRLERRLAWVLESAVRWFGRRPARLLAQGGMTRGQITVQLGLEGGFSILASVSGAGIGQPVLEIVVFGNRGMLSWEPAAAASSAAARHAERAISPEIRPWLDALRQSLAEGAPVGFDGRRTLPATAIAAVFEASGLLSVSPNQAPCVPLAPPYGVLLVSGDHTHQPGYAEAMAADRRCRLIGLVDEEHVSTQRKALNEQLAGRLGIPVLPDLRRAIRREDVHVVSVCAEPERRGPIIVQAAQAGKHLYLDKPLCATLQEADQIVAAVRAACVVSQMFSSVSFEPARRVRSALAAGELGELTAVHCDLCFAKGSSGTADLSQPRRESPRPRDFERADSKRELTNIGVYSVVQLLWLLERGVRRVFATTGNFFFGEHQANALEDFGQVILEMEGDLTASLTAGRTGWRSHPDGGLNRTYLVGTRRTAVIDAHRPRVEVWADVEPWASPARDPDDPMGMWGPLPNSPYRPTPKQTWIVPAGSPWSLDTGRFFDCIEQGRPSDVPAELAAAATEVLLAAYQSAASGQWVRLPLPRTPVERPGA